MKESECQRPINLILSSGIPNEAAVVAAPILKLCDLKDDDGRPALVKDCCNQLVNCDRDTGFPLTTVKIEILETKIGLTDA